MRATSRWKGTREKYSFGRDKRTARRLKRHATSRLDRSFGMKLKRTGGIKNQRSLNYK